MSPNVEKVSYAWGLQFLGWKPPALVGVYYFTDRCRPWHDGMRQALFRTRREARAAAQYLKLLHIAKTSPVKVRIAMTWPR